MKELVVEIIRSNSVFEKRSEVVNLMVPVALLLVTLFDVLFFKILYTPQVRLWEALVVKVLFLNFSHIALTYIMLFRLPEFRLWTKLAIKEKGHYFWLRLVMAASAVFLVYYCGRMFDSSIFTIAAYFGIILGFQHLLFQSFGLSQSYNHLPEIKNDMSSARARKITRLEKGCYYMILVALTLDGLTQAPVKTNFELNSIAIFCISLASFGVAGIFLIPFFAPALRKTNKVIFNIRMLLFPLTLLSPIASSSIAVIHSVEYYFVFKKINARSSQPQEKREALAAFAILMLIVFGMVFVVRFYLRNFVLPDRAATPAWFAMFSALISTMVIMHYFLDRIMFRFDDAMTRNLISPLLSSESKLRSATSEIQTSEAV